MRRRAAVYVRYLVFQIPGMFMAGVVLALLVQWTELTPPLGWVLFGLWVLKDVAMFPVTRIAYELPHNPHGPEALLGETGVAQDALDGPGAGWILVRGELWRARVRPGASPVAKGERVRVVETDGTILVIEDARA